MQHRDNSRLLADCLLHADDAAAQMFYYCNRGAHAAAGAASATAVAASASAPGLYGCMLTPMLRAVPMTLLHSDSSVSSGASFCFTCAD